MSVRRSNSQRPKFGRLASSKRNNWQQPAKLAPERPYLDALIQSYRDFLALRDCSEEVRDEIETEIARLRGVQMDLATAREMRATA